MVRVERRDDVAAGIELITLDRPEVRNAVDHDTLLALLEAIDRIAEPTSGVRVVVLTGSPPAFSAGADLLGVEESAFADALAGVLHGFAALGVPVMAAIDGPALGAGAQLAAVSDLRVATADSVVGIPAARLGLAVDHWTVDRMVHEFGASVARNMLLGASTYRGDELHVMGAVHRLGDLDDALGWAERLAQLAPLTLAAHKRAIEASFGRRDDDHEAEVARARAWASADATEGRSAFLDKRRPIFRGE